MGTNTGHREGANDGKVTHFRLGASVACKTKGDNRQASPNPKLVNCFKCMVLIAKMRGQR